MKKVAKVGAEEVATPVLAEQAEQVVNPVEELGAARVEPQLAGPGGVGGAGLCRVWTN